jgi:hypothetical protein
LAPFNYIRQVYYNYCWIPPYKAQSLSRSSFTPKAGTFSTTTYFDSWLTEYALTAVGLVDFRYFFLLWQNSNHHQYTLELLHTRYRHSMCPKMTLGALDAFKVIADFVSVFLCIKPRTLGSCIQCTRLISTYVICNKQLRLNRTIMRFILECLYLDMYSEPKQ